MFIVNLSSLSLLTLVVRAQASLALTRLLTAFIVNRSSLIVNRYTPTSSWKNPEGTTR